MACRVSCLLRYLHSYKYRPLSSEVPIVVRSARCLGETCSTWRSLIRLSIASRRLVPQCAGFVQLDRQLELCTLVLLIAALSLSSTAVNSTMLTRLLKALGWGQASTPAPATEDVNGRRARPQHLGLFEATASDEPLELQLDRSLQEIEGLGPKFDRLSAMLEANVAAARATWTPEQRRRFDAVQAAWDAPLDGNGELEGRETRTERSMGRTVARSTSNDANPSTVATGSVGEHDQTSTATASG